MLELEQREQQLSADAGFLARLAPAQTAGDHQVDDEKQRIGGRRLAWLEHEHDAFADAPHAGYALPERRVERRIDRAQHERAAKQDPVEPASGHARRQRLDVDHNVRKLGHVDIVARSMHNEVRWRGAAEAVAKASKSICGCPVCYLSSC